MKGAAQQEGTSTTMTDPSSPIAGPSMKRFGVEIIDASGWSGQAPIALRQLRVGAESARDD